MIHLLSIKSLFFKKNTSQKCSCIFVGPSGVSQNPSSNSYNEGAPHAHAQAQSLVELCSRFSLTNVDIHMEVSDEHILEIYLQLENWEQVAPHLGLTNADIQAIEKGAKSDQKLMRMHMLQEWKQIKMLDGTATYEVLLKALIKCNCSKSAIQVCELLNKQIYTASHYCKH